MELKLENISIIYCDENDASSRELLIREDEEITFIDLVDTISGKDSTSICLNIDQLKLLRDSLTLILNNK